MLAQGIHRFTIAAALATGLLTGQAQAEDISIVERALPGAEQRPQAIVVGPDGNLWVTEVRKHQIFRVTPAG